jgi:hypothetical protein
MNSGGLKELSWRFLGKLYELSEGGMHPEVNYDLAMSSLGCSKEQARGVVDYLQRKGYISFECMVTCVRITPKGIDKVDTAMAQTYAAKEFRVLKAINESGHKAYNGWVNLDDLQRDLSDIPRHELFMILNDLEKRKGLIDSIDQAVWIVPAGFEELDRAERFPDRATQYFPPNIINNYTVNVQGDNRANIQQGGQGNTQTTIVVGSDFEQAIRQLLAGIEQSQLLTPLQKIKARGDVQTVNDLAGVEKTPEVVAEADTRISAIQAVLSTTADLVSLGMVVIPILRAAFGG